MWRFVKSCRPSSALNPQAAADKVNTPLLRIFSSHANVVLHIIRAQLSSLRSSRSSAKAKAAKVVNTLSLKTEGLTHALAHAKLY
jgi:hypothetical protein